VRKVVCGQAEDSDRHVTTPFDTGGADRRSEYVDQSGAPGRGLHPNYGVG